MNKFEDNAEFQHSEFDSLRLYGLCHELLYYKIPSKLADATDITYKITRQIVSDSSLVEKYHIPIYKSHDTFTDGIPSVKIRFIPRELEDPLTTDMGTVIQLTVNIPEAFIQDTDQESFSLATIKIIFNKKNSQQTIQYALTEKDICEYKEFSLLDFIVEHETSKSDIVKVDSNVSKGLVDHSLEEKIMITESIVRILDEYVIGAQSRKDNTM